VIENKLSQTVTWKQVTGVNAYGENTTSSSTIAVRWEGRRRLVRDTQGREVISEARIFTLAAISPGDLLTYGGRDWPVISVSESRDMAGALLFYEVAL